MERKVVLLKSALSMNNSTVSPMSSESSLEIRYIDQKNMKYFWSESSWESTLLDCSSIIFALYQDEKMVGFSLYQISENVAHMLKIVIDSENRGHDLGHLLLSSNFLSLKNDGVSKVMLEVSSDNTYAKNLYHRLGFITYHVSKMYYSDGCDALKMKLSLLP